MRIVSDLKSVMEAIAAYLGEDAEELYVLAQKDQHTGWDFDLGDWPCGSLHRPEGQILYVLTRLLKTAPVEIGSWHGCSATHMAEALRDERLNERVRSVDLNGMIQDRIPGYLRNYISANAADGHDYLNALDDESELLIYEDAGHDREGTAQFWREGLQKLAPGGIMVSHDPENALVGPSVVAGVEDAGITNYLIVRVPPSDCGLILYRKPAAPAKETKDESAQTTKRKAKRHAAAVR